MGAAAIEALLAEGGGLARPQETERSDEEPSDPPRLRLVSGE